MGETTDSVEDWQAKMRQQVLNALKEGPIAIVGCGNPLKGDDSIGSKIARDLLRELVGQKREKLVILDAESSPENFIHILEEAKPSNIYFIDALEMGKTPGTVSLIDLDSTSYPYFSTHGIPLKLLVQTLSRIPRAFVLGVQPKSTEFDVSLSAEVDSAGRSIVAGLTKILEEVIRR